MATRPLDAAVHPDGQDPDGALADLERRRDLVASELSRLSAALDEALSGASALHADAPREPAAGPTPAPTATPTPAAAAETDVTTRLPRLSAPDGGSPWAPPRPQPATTPPALTVPPPWSVPPSTAGTAGAASPVLPAKTAAPETTAPSVAGMAAAGRPRRLPVALAAMGVSAVVLLAVVFVLQRGRDSEQVPTTGEAPVAVASEAPVVVSPSEVTAAAESEASVAPSPPAPTPPATRSRALDRVLTAAATAPGALPDATQALVTRVPTLQRLDGPARAEEAADIYGLAVIAARAEDTPGPATALVDALAPEVTFEALDLVARRRPEVVGAGVAPLLDEFAALPTAPAATQRVRAQALLDAMIAGVERGTVSAGFCNVGAYVLEPYLEAT